jgi:hypothetical protein
MANPWPGFAGSIPSPGNGIEFIPELYNFITGETCVCLHSDSCKRVLESRQKMM